MLRFTILLATVLVASAHPSNVGIFEKELTEALQKFLGPRDPHIIANITGLHITTDHSSITFNAYDTEMSGFANVVVTFFEPPIPLITKIVKMNVMMDMVKFHTDDYSLSGTFNGEPTNSAGMGDMIFNKFGMNLVLKAESYKLEPVKLCVQEGSLTVDLTVESIDGADDINADIDANGPTLMEGVQVFVNENADVIVAVINGALCDAP
ncbi:hypothetical protein Hamer_G022830 [Homarus americanus]|uniref:Uncharacterized protein n=1 Tax=Homarus americanus TaxID=6706 RepID=A0A8J5N3Z3_HOMAM|nr:hypothetical protein Hamer_G022830 [Homarus americanus]